MPKYNKSRKYNKTSFRSLGKKVAWYDRKFTAFDVASKALRGVKYLKGIINSELHRFDFTTSAQTLDSTGAVYSLSNMAQGDDVGNRVGNSLLAKSLYGRYTLYRDPLNTNTINSCRVLIIKDLENTGTAPTLADVLQASNPISPLHVDHTPRYQILYDKVHTLSANGAEGMNCKFFIRINDHIKYTGPNAADIYKNNLFAMTIGSEPAGSHPVGLNWYSRLSFYDN